MLFSDSSNASIGENHTIQNKSLYWSRMEELLYRPAARQISRCIQHEVALVYRDGFLSDDHLWLVAFYDTKGQ